MVTTAKNHNLFVRFAKPSSLPVSSFAALQSRTTLPLAACVGCAIDAARYNTHAATQHIGNVVPGRPLSPASET